MVSFNDILEVLNRSKRELTFEQIADEINKKFDFITLDIKLGQLVERGKIKQGTMNVLVSERGANVDVRTYYSLSLDNMEDNQNV